MNKEWFNWYCQQIDKDKKWASYRDRYLCPCCFMPTLSERSSYDICCICYWEDDGQDSDDAEIVRGGPNSDYSLAEARVNFQSYFTMYRPNDNPAFEIEQKERELKETLYYAYIKAMKSNLEPDWMEVLSIEEEYEDHS